MGHSKIHHPNIIRFYGHRIVGKKVLLLLELAENGDLFNYIIKQSPLDYKTACKFFVQTAKAVQNIHSHNMIHRDIKPENLLLDENYNIKLCDFGWCAEYDGMTRRETVCGTYEYMAPEIVFKKQQSTGIDVWSLGILLYELIHNKPPYPGRSLHDIRKHIISSTVTFRSDIDPDAKDIIQKILRVKTEDRPTIEQLLEHPFVKKYYQESKQRIRAELNAIPEVPQFQIAQQPKLVTPVKIKPQVQRVASPPVDMKEMQLKNLEDLQAEAVTDNIGGVQVSSIKAKHFNVSSVAKETPVKPSIAISKAPCAEVVYEQQTISPTKITIHATPSSKYGQIVPVKAADSVPQKCNITSAEYRYVLLIREDCQRLRIMKYIENIILGLRKRMKQNNTSKRLLRLDS